MSISSKLSQKLEDVNNFISESKCEIVNNRNIQSGVQLLIFNGSEFVNINVYETGKIHAHGKPSDFLDFVKGWIKLQTDERTMHTQRENSLNANRTSKYKLSTENIEKVRNDIMENFHEFTTIITKNEPAEFYRLEINQDAEKVFVTQFSSGTLLIQNKNNFIFDRVCDLLDSHITQTYEDRTRSFIPDSPSLEVVSQYIDQNPRSENDAVNWLQKKLNKDVLDFLCQKDHQTLKSAAGVYLAIQNSKSILEDYSVIVMPFAKVYEGFIIELAINLGLTDREKIKENLSEVQISKWIGEIKTRIPDNRRYSLISNSLISAWDCRNKTMHSDPEYPLGIISSLIDADKEISMIIRAMEQAHRLFISEQFKLRKTSTI